MPPTEPPSPPVPADPPQIPRGKLWKCLLLPAVVTLIANLFTAIAGSDSYAYHLWFLPLIAGPLTGFICTPWFVQILKTCYQGRSMVLMSISYGFGQLILTPAIGFGGCVLTANTFGL